MNALDRGWDELLEPLATARFSAWQPFEQAVATSPEAPGVYVVRDDSLMVAYVGMAGARTLRSRLRDYLIGNDLNGLAERAMDAALADPEWVAQRLAELQFGRTSRPAKEWMRLAMRRHELRLSTAPCHDRYEARSLEAATIRALKLADRYWARAVVTKV